MICCSKIIYNRQQNPLFSVEKVLKSFHVTSRSHGFPHSSIGNESACNAGDPGSIPGLGRSTGEGIGNPLQYSWASLVAQVVENLPAMQETWVQSLGWEDPLEKGKATHCSILAWRIPWILLIICQLHVLNIFSQFVAFYFSLWCLCMSRNS